MTVKPRTRWTGTVFKWLIEQDQDQEQEQDQVVDRARRRTERKVREAFHIYKLQLAMNRDAGIERSAVWNAILQKLSLAC